MVLDTAEGERLCSSFAGRQLTMATVDMIHATTAGTTTTEVTVATVAISTHRATEAVTTVDTNHATVLTITTAAAHTVAEIPRFA